MSTADPVNMVIIRPCQLYINTRELTSRSACSEELIYSTFKRTIQTVCPLWYELVVVLFPKEGWESQAKILDALGGVTGVQGHRQPAPQSPLRNALE